MKLKIGTRKSALALAQTKMVEHQLKKAFPSLETELVCISTKGDRILDRSLASFGGKGVFVSEIESRLLSGEIDIAVHSAKDLPTELMDGLEISAVLPRGDHRDVLVTKKGTSRFQKGFVTGTGSMRRRVNFAAVCPDAVFKEIRGNIDTRLKKLLNDEYDGIILAAAGLERLGFDRDDRFDLEYFDGCSSFLPSPCQGIIAVESRRNDAAASLVKAVNDENTFAAFETERCLIQYVNGGCGVPLGAYAYVKDGKIWIAASKDGKKIVRTGAAIEERMECVRELIKCL